MPNFRKWFPLLPQLPQLYHVLVWFPLLPQLLQLYLVLVVSINTWKGYKHLGGDWHSAVCCVHHAWQIAGWYAFAEWFSWGNAGKFFASVTPVSARQDQHQHQPKAQHQLLPQHKHQQLLSK